MSLDELISGIGPEASPARVETPQVRRPGLTVARLIGLDGRRATIAFRGERAPFPAELDEEVERELAVRALEQKSAVLVEIDEQGRAFVMGIVQTKRPREVVIEGESVRLEGAREVVLRAGRAALRLREDGDVELVGSRISAASRGLFRLVGRILRLN